MLEKVIVVGMADLKVAKAPDILTTIGLGSCVGISLYDISTGVGGMAHVMLPSSREIQNQSNPAKFVDTAIAKLIDDVVRAGARKSNLKAKIAGGAQMFALKSDSQIMKIGTRNYEESVKALRSYNIPIVSMDCGGNYGRTIELKLATGELKIKAIDKAVKII